MERPIKDGKVKAVEPKEGKAKLICALFLSFFFEIRMSQKQRHITRSKE
jgi:hypothetical protein